MLYAICPIDVTTVESPNVVGNSASPAPTSVHAGCAMRGLNIALSTASLATAIAVICMPR